MESQEQIFMINSSNRAINAADDANYGEILKSGDNTLLKYKIFDGDGEILQLEGLPCEAVIKKEDIAVYRTPAEVDAENVVSFKITEVLPGDRNNPYTIEFIITQGQDTLIFPSDDRINLYVYPSSLSTDIDIIEQTPEERLNEIVIVAVNDVAQEINLGIDNIRNTLESEFEANEADRQQEFESNETGRQQEFEANEAVRQSQEESREIAETARQSAESQRESTFTANETGRQSTFDTNENARQETFENNESERQTNYNELVDTGIMQENINQKLSESEQTYAPRLTNLEQNDATLTAQLSQTVDEVNKAVSEATVDSEVILARGGEATLGVRLDKSEERDSERDSKIEEIERVATKPLKPIHTLKVENEVFSSDEVSVSEGIITINNHNLKAGDKVAFVATATSYNVFEPFDGAMRLNTVYYVVNPSSDSFQISTTDNGEPIAFNIDTKGFLWQFEKVNVMRLEVKQLDGTKYRVVFTGAHDGRNLSRRLLNVYTNPGNVATRYSSEDNENTITATDIKPVHGVMDIYSEMFFKVINRKILITVNSSFTTITTSTNNHNEETYKNRILTRVTNPTVGFQDSINLIGVGGRHLFDGSTLEVYEA